MAINIYSFNYLYKSFDFIKKQIVCINRDKYTSAGIMVDSSEIATRIASFIQITIFIIRK